MATTTIKSKIHTITTSGTTNNAGAMALDSVVPKDKTILSVACTSHANAMCIPWLYNNDSWYMRAVDWNGFANSYANMNVSLVIRYTD